MIQGVRVKALRVIADDRGWLSGILRSDDDLFIRFGQVHMTTARRVVKGWHCTRSRWTTLPCCGG